jgi:hypothetical protein
MTTTLSFKIFPEEASFLRSEARKQQLTLSEYLRRTLLVAKNTTTQKPRLEKSKLTGSLVLVSPEGTPPLTSERVRELLADFP